MSAAFWNRFHLLLVTFPNDFYFLYASRFFHLYGSVHSPALCLFYHGKCILHCPWKSRQVIQIRKYIVWSLGQCLLVLYVLDIDCKARIWFFFLNVASEVVRVWTVPTSKIKISLIDSNSRWIYTFEKCILILKGSWLW